MGIGSSFNCCKGTLRNTVIFIDPEVEPEPKKDQDDINNYIKENSIQKNKPIKYWKNVLLHFLEKQNKLGITWCKELYQIIKAYQFNSERKYLDSFFFYKFEIRTKPKCQSTGT